MDKLERRLLAHVIYQESCVRRMSKILEPNTKPQKIATVIILLILWIFLFWVFVCWAIWDGGYYLTTTSYTDPPRWKPSVNDIVGTWKLSDDSIKFVQDSGSVVPFHEIEFYEDGTFRAVNFPKWIEWSDEKAGLEFFTGTGTWEFDRMRFKPWSVELYYDKSLAAGFPGDYFPLQGKEPPYKMDDTPLMFERK
jgi:hypothetical protein